MEQLDLGRLPVYCYSAYKIFKPGEWHVERICPEDVLLLMTDGCLYFQEDDRPITLSAGQYYIQRRGLQQSSDRPSDNARYYYIHFIGQYADGRSTLPLCGRFELSALIPHIRQLERLQPVGGSPVELTAEFYGILAALKGANETAPETRMIHEILARFAEGFARPFSLDAVCAECGYSKNHLIRIFKRETGLTPYAYITNLRIAAAKRLLTDSDLPVGEIATDCGFGDYVNLYKAFLRETGRSPTEWRKQRRA